MKLPKIFLTERGIQKRIKKIIEQKNFSPLDTAWDFGNLYDYFTYSQNYLITKILAVSYYTKCSPIFNAVDMIATAIANLTPKIYDKKTGEWVGEHPVLDLLAWPNADITWWEFVYSLASFYVVTGDFYILGSGVPMTPPKELYIYPATAVTIIAGKDGMADTLTPTLYWGSETHKRYEIPTVLGDTKRLRYRYFNDRATSEIWHAKFFNPTTIQSNVYGMSPLNPVYYEINQHNSANRHNLSVLERGATPSGIMNINPSVSHDDFVRLQQQMENQFAGSANAGRVMLVNGLGEFKGTTLTNKDMDFLKLKEDVVKAMYRTLKIPISLVAPETMTLDKIEKAILLFYDMAVLPLATRIFSELTNFLMPRYDKNNSDLVISFDEGDIISLEPRRNEQLKVLKDLGIFTINQLRAECGAEPLDGGGIMYGPSMQTPIATDPNDESMQLVYEGLPGLDVVGGDDEKLGSSTTEKTTRARFTEILKGKVDEDGNPLFTDDEINKIADKHGLE